MKTIKIIKLCVYVLLFCIATNASAQNIGGILKNKSKKVIDKTIDKGIEKIEGKDKNNKQENEEGIKTENRTPLSNFISGNILFSDNFNNERAGEFPSKWTQVSGSVQNKQVHLFGKNYNVVEWISNSATIKPTFKEDTYLGQSFKIELEVYFHGNGNEWYNINLKNSKNPYKNHDIRISWFGISSGSDVTSRLPGKGPEGWHTIQISFNKGNLKAFYDGIQLINDPDIEKYTFDFLEVYVGSPGSTRPQWESAKINNFKIGGSGLALYKRLVTDGRIIVHDIHFDRDSYFIKPASYPAIDKIFQLLNQNPNTSVIIEGHTDSNGSNESNQRLSENRAKAVMNYLVIKGIDIKRLKTIGYGEERPLVKGNNEKAWAQNRRVEFVLNN
ncbi:OmpA family protein [Seonamhaeicola sp.]|uniref:OmpA family protein n=1 Tax=Seonamhaeicola sp. TaxID=1912245 RepID=UPI0026314F6D|nr:OmpA family protein [Seonamhaeicola sp.]